MAGYTTAVTDWTAADYFNVADWIRIYRNGQLASALSAIELATAIAFNTITEPTTSTIADVDDFNTLLANLERLRLAVAGESIPGTSTEIKDDYIAGVKQPTFKFSDVNLWESTIDSIWNYWSGGDLEECPTLTDDLTVLTGTQIIYVDCLNIDTYLLRVQGTGELYIL